MWKNYVDELIKGGVNNALKPPVSRVNQIDWLNKKFCSAAVGPDLQKILATLSIIESLWPFFRNLRQLCQCLDSIG